MARSREAVSEDELARSHVQGQPWWIPVGEGRQVFARVLPGPQADGDGPTVVFEAGAAATRSSWGLVQPAVGRWARAIVYDRSGLGRSAEDPGGRTLRRMSEDLGAVLDQCGKGPFVLVGHSAGGPLVRRAAADRPERITGLVLVDPTDEAADVLFSRAFRRLERAAIVANTVLARTGLLRRVFRPMTAVMPADVRRDLEQDAFTLKMVRTHAAQARTFLDELAAFRDDPPALGDLPVTVISGALGGNGMNAKLRAQANAAHAHRVACSPRGRHVIAERSGHYVPITDPEVVFAEIRRLLDRSDAPSD